MADECRLTVFFEAPFWIGLYERVDCGSYTVCKITFGGEPKDYEVYEFLRQNWRTMAFSPPVQAGGQGEKAVNPKRMQRAISRQLQERGASTKAQQALQLQREESKARRAARTRERKEAERQLQFALRQEKRKAKHRGR